MRLSQAAAIYGWKINILTAATRFSEPHMLDKVTKAQGDHAVS
jgi:hypothetical protein